MAEDRMLSDEILLGLIKANSGGGGGGTSNYNDLSNKPQIGGTTLTGNKTASDLGLVAEETGKGLSTNDYTNADKAIVAGVTAALADKQDALTAGNYVSINDNGTINVTQSIGVYDVYSYELVSTGVGITIQLTKKINNVTISTREIRNEDYSAENKLIVDGLFELWYDMSNFYWHYKLLVDSKEHQKNEDISWYYRTMADYTETFDVSQDSSTDLATKGDVNTAINAIKDGQSIDSFADVETALAGKQETLTFDDVPTDNSNNPVKSNGIYDALALKQNATDNNLDTDAKTIVGAINEHEGDIDSLKSGLTNVQDDAKLNTQDLTTPSRTKNLLPMTLNGIKSANTTGTWSGNAYTANDVTFTVQTDSDENVLGITANGTATQGTLFYLYKKGSDTSFPTNDYILTGCADGGSNSTWRIIGVEVEGGSNVYFGDSGSGATFNTTATKYLNQIYIEVFDGVNISNKAFYPMIRLATITDPTFAPYIPSVESRIEAVESGLLDVTITDNTHLGQYDLSSYTSDRNQYTAPSEGWVYIKNESGKNCIAHVYNDNMTIGGVEGRFVIPVKKGCKIYVEGSATAVVFKVG